MKKYGRLYLLSGIIIILSVVSSRAQTTNPDSSQGNALNNASVLFHLTIANESRLYNGPEYYLYDPHITGNAYFSEVSAFTPGSVYYDGEAFTGVPMLYDLVKDQVVVLSFNKFQKFSLLSEKVKNFDFLNHHFVYINTDTLASNSSIKTGFYDALYQGKTEVLVKRSKTIQSKPNVVTVERYFDSTKDLYLKKGSTYHSIGGEGSLLDVLKDQKKALQKYIKANKIKFHRDPEDAMVKIAAYYDHLTS